jgi:PAS domain S-box-containing protein
VERKEARRRQGVAGGSLPRRTKRSQRVVKQAPALPDRASFEHNLIGMYRTSWDGRIIDCNESMARMLGFRSRNELLRHRAVELYHSPADREEFLNRLRAAGSLKNSELCLRHKDGAPIYILENVSLLPDEHGGPATIQGTMVDITDRKLAERALRESESRHRALADELRRLTRYVQDVREQERTRIARELHDELGQTLTVLNMDLHWLREHPRLEFDIAQARLGSMCKLLDTAIRAVRRICTELRPSVLDDLGLVAAIEWQTREFQARTGIRCVTSLPGAALDLPKGLATAVFRILQESLTNIVRHARATQAKVSLAARSKTLLLKVSDNGLGITRQQASGRRSLGLLGMRERAIQWQGQVDVSGVPRRGTTVVLRMPLEQDDLEAIP